jgi:hypothetical protein
VAYIPVKQEKLAPVKDILPSLDLFMKLSLQDIGQFDKIMFMRRGKETIFKVNLGSPRPVMQQEPGVHHHEGETVAGTHGDYRYEIVKTPGTVRVKGYNLPISGILDRIDIAVLCFWQK